MNWGWKIAIAYTLFALMTVGFVVLGSMKKVNLVEEDYYEQEIKYQERIDRIKNAVESTDEFAISYDAAGYELTLEYSGKSLLNGEVHLFRPSDAEKDMLLPLKIEKNGQQSLNTKSLLKGLWVVKVNWEAEGKDYFKSQQIYIQ